MMGYNDIIIDPDFPIQGLPTIELPDIVYNTQFLFETAGAVMAGTIVIGFIIYFCLSITMTFLNTIGKW